MDTNARERNRRKKTTANERGSTVLARTGFVAVVAVMHAAIAKVGRLAGDAPANADN
jgi:hypothetical protein